MKKAKLRKDNRPQRKGFFEQKHIDIYRSGDMLIFQDTSGFSSREPGEFVENLRFICFENSSGRRAMIDIEQGRTRSYQPYTTMPTDDDERITLQEARYDDYNTPRPHAVSVPYVQDGIVISRELLAYFAEDIAEQVVREERNLPETLLNRIEYLEEKIRMLEDSIVNLE